MARRSLLRQPVAQAAGRIALIHLDATRAARARLEDAGDTEALHDFRVALRRTRSVLRAYRPWLGRIPRRLRRRLRALARATNAARDTEVIMDWLGTERRKTGKNHRAGFVWLETRLIGRYAESSDAIRGEVLQEFSGVEESLRASLAQAANSHREASASSSYAAVTAELIRQHAKDLNEQLCDILSVEDTEAIHAARIRGKRLRYLIEPLAAELPAAKTIIRRLKLFQDRFGVLCDAFVQGRELAAAVETAGAGAARGRLERALGMRRPAGSVQHVLPGLIALARRLRDETHRRYAVVERHYLGDCGGRFLELFESLAGILSGRKP